MPSDTPRAAHRKDCFWQISAPPTERRSTARILPGTGAANATRRFWLAWFMNTVVNTLVPLIRRLPAPTSAPHRPEFCCEPSPKTVSSTMPFSMNIIEPASPTAASPGSSSTSTNCISAPLIS